MESARGTLPAVVQGVEEGCASRPGQRLLPAVSSKGVYPQSCLESFSPIPLWRCQQGSLPGPGNRKLPPISHPATAGLKDTSLGRWDQSQDLINLSGLPPCPELTICLDVKA